LIGVKIVPKRVKGFGEKKVVTIIQKKIDEIDGDNGHNTQLFIM